jgi:hypothetical protein
MIRHDIYGQYAIPKHHPITCANPAPWEIHEVKLISSFDEGIKVMIRNSESMWFNAANCYIGDHKDMLEMSRILQHRQAIESLYFQYNTNQP